MLGADRYRPSQRRPDNELARPLRSSMSRAIVTWQSVCLRGGVRFLACRRSVLVAGAQQLCRLTKAISGPLLVRVSGGFEVPKHTLKLLEGLRPYPANSRERLPQCDNGDHHQSNREREARTHYDLGYGVRRAE